MSKQEKEFNAGLLDRSIDDIEDLPGFAVPPNGVYVLKFSTDVKVVKDTDRVEAQFEVLNTVEMNDPDEEPPKEGTKFSMLFNLGDDQAGKIGEGKLKALLLPISKHFGVSNMATLVTETCKDLVVSAKVRRRADKEDKEKFYADVSEIQVQ